MKERTLWLGGLSIMGMATLATIYFLTLLFSSCARPQSTELAHEVSNPCQDLAGYWTSVRGSELQIEVVGDTLNFVADVWRGRLATTIRYHGQLEGRPMKRGCRTQLLNAYPNPNTSMMGRLRHLNLEGVWDPYVHVKDDTLYMFRDKWTR